MTAAKWWIGNADTDPLGTDPAAEAIERNRQYAASARTANKVWLRWQMDHWRYDVGLLEVVDDRDPGPYPTRFLPCSRPCFAAPHGHFVRDKMTPDSERVLRVTDKLVRGIRRLHAAGAVTQDEAAVWWETIFEWAAHELDRSQP